MSTSPKPNTKKINWFNRPYHFNDSNTFRLATSVGLAIFVGLFIAFVRPFNLDKLTENLTAYAFFCAVIALVDLLFCFFVLTKLFPSFFNGEKWTVGKQLLTILILWFIGSVLAWVFNQYLFFDTAFRFLTFFQVAMYTFGIAIIPTMLYVMIDERYGNYKASTIISKEIVQLKKKNKTTKKTPKKGKIIIYASNEKDYIEVTLDNILYIVSSLNYIDFYLKNEKGLTKKKNLRKQLKATKKDLENYPQFFHCHKSYIVNTNYVTHISGNARGYYLHLDNFDMEIPVSRKFKKADLLRLVK